MDEKDLILGIDLIPFDETAVQYLGLHSPELWNEVVQSLNGDVETTVDILQWIVEQPKCDMATALLVFMKWCEPEDVFNELGDRWERSKDRKLVKTVCENSENGFYSISNFAPSSMHRLPLDVLAEIESACLHRFGSKDSPLMPVPRKLLKNVYPENSPDHTGYFGDEGGIYSIEKTVPKKEWHLYGWPPTDVIV